jgi:hypothetical protein
MVPLVQSKEYSIKKVLLANFKTNSNQINYKNLMSLFNKILGNSSEVSFEKLVEKYGRLLADGEQIDLGFQLFRDTFIFTNKRLILIDVQGVTGSKIEYKSMPYKSITRFSLETAGTFELDAELKIWISSEATPSVIKKFNKSIDIYEVQRYLASRVL